MRQIRQTLFLDVSLLQVDEETDPRALFYSEPVGHLRITGHCRVTTEVADLVRDLAVAIQKLHEQGGP